MCTYIHIHTYIHTQAGTFPYIAPETLLQRGAVQPQIFSHTYMHIYIHTHIHTYIHTQAGTFPYIAPETLLQGRCSTASDIFSFGLLMWELVHGETPFSDVPNLGECLCVCMYVCIYTHVFVTM